MWQQGIIVTMVLFFFFKVLHQWHENMFGTDHACYSNSHSDTMWASTAGYSFQIVALVLGHATLCCTLWVCSLWPSTQAAHNFPSVDCMQSTDNKRSVSQLDERTCTSLFCSKRKSEDETLVASQNWGHNMKAAQGLQHLACEWLHTIRVRFRLATTTPSTFFFREKATLRWISKRKQHAFLQVVNKLGHKISKEKITFIICLYKVNETTKTTHRYNETANPNEESGHCGGLSTHSYPSLLTSSRSKKQPSDTAAARTLVQPSHQCFTLTAAVFVSSRSVKVFQTLLSYLRLGLRVDMHYDTQKKIKIRSLENSLWTHSELLATHSKCPPYVSICSAPAR